MNWNGTLWAQLMSVSQVKANFHLRRKMGMQHFLTNLCCYKIIYVWKILSQTHFQAPRCHKTQKKPPPPYLTPAQKYCKYSNKIRSNNISVLMFAAIVAIMIGCLSNVCKQNSVVGLQTTWPRRCFLGESVMTSHDEQWPRFDAKFEAYFLPQRWRKIFSWPVGGGNTLGSTRWTTRVQWGR